ncbi:MAG: glutamate synthase, partial [Planctomycetota bacterium]
MAKATGFLEHERKDAPKRSVEERIRDHREIEQPLPPEELTAQAVRCMDCGVPFCHAVGCPLGNVVPEWNEMVYRGRWREALELLHSTNNFPEITGRVCPAPCEAACTLAINQEPVTIRQIELQVCERGWEEGWIRPRPAAA